MRSVALNRKMLPYAVALTLLAGAALVSTPARGVTLGNVASQSALGQPLRLVIPIDLGHAETVNSACLRLVADNSAGDAPQIVTGRVGLERESTTSPRLVITTPTAIREPAARISVQIGCGSTVRRDYVLFFDPAALDSHPQLAVADVEDPPWTRIPRQNLVAVAHSADVAPAAPRSTWGTPVPTGPAPEAPVARSEPKPEAAVAAAPAVVPTELVALTASTGSGMFIQEAAAASLPARTVAPQAVNAPRVAAQSLPLANMNPQRASGSSAAAAWQMAWPFAAGIFGTMALAILGFVVHRRYLQEKSWLDPKARTTLRGETQAGNPQATFAHFPVMTEPAKIKPRVALDLPALDATVPNGELDTLLADIQSDLIDERAIKEAYKAAADDSGMDMGSDSILKAIAEAERDLQIGTPEPKQVALDTALDNDLMKVPQAPKGVR